MTEEEAKKFIEVVKKSREEIGDKYNELAKEVDNDLKAKLGEEKWEVYLAANGTEEDEEKLIEKIGKEKYVSLLNEITTELAEELKKNNN